MEDRGRKREGERAIKITTSMMMMANKQQIKARHNAKHGVQRSREREREGYRGWHSEKVEEKEEGEGEGTEGKMNSIGKQTN